MINRTLHGLERASRVEKYFTRFLRTLVKYFSTLDLRARPRNIFYLYVLFLSIYRKNERVDILLYFLFQ